MNTMLMNPPQTIEVGGGCRVTADGLRTVEQPRIHCDGSAVVGERSFVVLVDIVVIEEVEIAIGCLFSVHLFEFVAE